MDVYYSGWGFMDDASLNDDDEEYPIYNQVKDLLERVSRKKYQEQFILPDHLLDDLKFVKRAEVNFLLYVDNGKPINVARYGAIEAKNVRLYLTDRQGNCTPMILTVDENTTLFQDKETGNSLRLLQRIEVQADPLFTPEYLNSGHPMFSKELSIAIEAWNAVLLNNPSKPNRGSRKTLITNWLKKNHNYLTGEAIERISVMLNPDCIGGSPKSI